MAARTRPRTKHVGYGRVMRQFFVHVIRRCGELLFHWTVAGLILIIWGITPEHFIAKVISNTPELIGGVSQWITSQIVRLPFALVGLGLIVWDIFLRTGRFNGAIRTHSYI